MKKIADDWLAKKFIEKPTQPGEWLSQSFAVPKDSKKFPWLGVVDMRAVNSQTSRCKYPYPTLIMFL